MHSLISRGGATTAMALDIIRIESLAVAVAKKCTVVSAFRVPPLHKGLSASCLLGLVVVVEGVM